MPLRAALFLLLAAQGTAGAGPLPLRWAPKEGDEIRYQTIGTLTVGGIDATLTSINAHKVLKVDSDGSFLVQTSPVSGKAVYGGQEYPIKGMTTLTNYGPGGELREIQGDRADATGYRMANLTGFHAPPKPVSVGDSWTSEGKADPKTGAVAWKVDYKVVGEETVGSFPTLKMDVAARETDGANAGKAAGSVWIGKDGTLVRSEMTWTNLAVPGAPVPVNGKLTVTRLE